MLNTALLVLFACITNAVSALSSTSVVSFKLGTIDVATQAHRSDSSYENVRVSFGNVPKKVLFPKDKDFSGIIRLSSLLSFLQRPSSLNSSDTQEHLFSYFNSSLTRNSLEAGPDAEYPRVTLITYSFLFDGNEITVSNSDNLLLLSKLQELSLPIESTYYSLVDYVPAEEDYEYYDDQTSSNQKQVKIKTFFGKLSFSDETTYYIVADTPNVQQSGSIPATEVQYQLVSKGQNFMRYYGQYEDYAATSQVDQYCLHPPLIDSEDLVLDEMLYNARFHSTGKVFGKGSFGKVSELEEKSSGKTFAVKEVRRCTTDVRLFKSIQSEIELMSSLRHDNILNAEALLFKPSKVYIVMESASTYGDSHNIIGRVSESVFHDMALNLTKGLAFMEQHNIVHRDIKMQNILFTNDGVVKYIDFGCAVTTGVATDIFGSPTFMAPEVLKTFRYGTTYGPKADVYSLGVTFFGHLFGSMTWNKSHTGFKDVSFLTKKNWNLGNLLSQMLESDPTKRPFASELLKHPYFTNYESRSQPFPRLFPHEKMDF